MGMDRDRAWKLMLEREREVHRRAEELVVGLAGVRLEACEAEKEVRKVVLQGPVAAPAPCSRQHTSQIQLCALPRSRCTFPDGFCALPPLWASLTSLPGLALRRSHRARGRFCQLLLLPLSRC